MPGSTATSARRPSSGRGQRLMVYLTGVLLGLVLLGFFKARSAREAAGREAQFRESQAQVPPDSASGTDRAENPGDAGERRGSAGQSDPPPSP